MKNLLAAVLFGTSIVLTGCNQGTSGGPGASSPPSPKPMVGQTEDTFSLAMSAIKMNQGESKTMSAEISRGKNFSEDVSLMLDGLPQGVSLEPAKPLIKHGDTEAKLTITASEDAALGDFTVKLMGHPTKGAEAVTEVKISIAKLSAKEVAEVAADTAKAKWDEYTAAMQTQLDQFNAKFAELKDSAAKAEGQAKTDLDLKLAEAKAKLDTAGNKLDELKAAGADRWEKVKEEVANAFDDLKKIFA